MEILNFKLLSHPMNWLTILLMLLMAGVGGHLVLSFFQHEPQTAKSQYEDLPAGQSTINS